MGQSARTLLGRHWPAGGLALVAGAYRLLVQALGVLPGDRWLLLTVQGWRAPWLDRAALAITLVGWWPVSSALAVLLFAGLLLTRRRRYALMAALIPVAVVAGYGLKLLVHRPRPDLLVIGPAAGGFSFPSLHALFAVLFGGVLMLLAQDLVARRRLRWTLQGLIVLLAAGVGASRVYLGVHWPSDVLGGYLLGILWVLEWRWLRERLPRGVVAKADGPPVGVV